ncbi:hypothetical protein GRI69_13555 [Erythrobacter vulgaris]|uniref:Spermidine synthase n=1 Tax=Qipengyuania vulgaris TaxID=291985 RepID=A0A844XU52_9SPHN|nr:hypothetical protein [Qipengyuania vulgaris]
MNSSRRALFVSAIFAGSFLLFLVQPMVARLVLPRLGGAPNVWNSAMLVYQALLLGGYAYAHAIRRLPVRLQIGLQLALLVMAGLTLPITLVDIPSFGAGLEVFWVPAFILASIGPVFFLVSAQAPLVQRWYGADPDAGDPYPLYAASNLGSFSGLLSYPLIIEPLLTLETQAMVWSVGYAVLLVLVSLLAWARWHAQDLPASTQLGENLAPVPPGKLLIWVALAAVPSGMMLSTTTHLTTDIFAMPLLWVIPLGLYLLSYVPGFAENRQLARFFTTIAPAILLVVGGMAMIPQSGDGLVVALASVGMLFVVSVALHAKLFDLRPPPGQLTLFYLAMSVGGVVGGLFSALIAPALFDWVWEHPILVFAAALLLPLGQSPPWKERLVQSKKLRLFVVFGTAVILSALSLLAFWANLYDNSMLALAGVLAMAAIAMFVKLSRFEFLMFLVLLMTALGIVGHLDAYSKGDRTRSYFGIYNVRDDETVGQRVLIHGTTMHGRQFLDPKKRLEPTAYYGRSSGVGMVLDRTVDLYGERSSVGVVGLGVGTVACYRRPEQTYRFYEIDPEVLNYSSTGRFSFLSRCAPESEIVIGDARIALEEEPANQYDVLVVDAFSSDAIPLHLLTVEAIGVYLNTLKFDGALLVHISNRFLELQPVLSAAALECGCAAAIREDMVGRANGQVASDWVLITRDQPTQDRILSATGIGEWGELEPPLEKPWSDNYASILPLIRWAHIIGI